MSRRSDSEGRPVRKDENPHAPETGVVVTQERMAAILHGMPDALIILDAKWHVRYINDVGAECFGLPTNEIIGKTLWDVLPDCVGTPFEDRLRRARHGDHADHFEYYFETRHHWCELWTLPCEDECIVIWRDMTERKRAERAVQDAADSERARAAELEAIMESVPAVMCLAHDPECHRITGSRSAYECLRMQPGDNLSKTAHAQEYPEHFRILQHGREISDEQLPLQRAARGEKVPDTELEIRFDDGTSRYLFGRAVTLRDLDGHIRGALAAMVDITDRKHTEQALSESEQRLRGIFDNAAVGIAHITLDGMLLDANETLCTMLGYDCDELVDHATVDDLTFEDDSAMVRDVREHIRRGDTSSVTMEVRFIHRDGTVFWAITSASVLRNSDGEPETLIGVVQDITHQKEIEAKLQSIVDHVASGIITINDHGIIETANPAAQQIFGYTADELVGQHVNTLVPELTGDPRHDVADILSSLKSNRAGTGREMLGWRKDGTTFSLELVLSDYVLGTRRMFTGLIRDITDRKHAEYALVESERRFRSIFETAQDPVCVFEITADRRPGAFLEVNDAACRTYGYRRDELLDMTLDDIVAKEEILTKFPEYVEQMMREGSKLLESEHRTKFGRRMTVEVRAQLITYINRLAVLSVVRDISERKEAERALQELNQTLEQRVAERTAEAEHRAKQLQLLAAELTDAEQRERRRLAQLLHDDLQQILVAARMRMAMVRPSDDEKSQQAAADAQRLLVDAIHASRSLSSELAPSVLYDLGFAPALEWLARWAREKYDLAVEVEADTAEYDLSEQVRVLLFEAVRELLLNVVKHAETSEARVMLEHDETSLGVTVEDYGRGFNVAEIEDNKNALRGYGLFALRERMKLMGGEVEIDSTPGKGTRVSITAPMKRTAVGAAPHTDAAPRDTAHEHDTKRTPARERPGLVRVLLVDDHEIMRQGMANLFEHQPDIEVIGEASTGEEALELVRHVAPDVVVMDISLPGISGIEATRRLRQVMQHVHVIGLSIHEEHDVCEALRAAGAAKFVSKSRPSDELLRAIREVASEHQPA